MKEKYFSINSLEEELSLNEVVINPLKNLRDYIFLPNEERDREKMITILGDLSNYFDLSSLKKYTLDSLKELRKDMDCFKKKSCELYSYIFDFLSYRKKKIEKGINKYKNIEGLELSEESVDEIESFCISVRKYSKSNKVDLSIQPFLRRLPRFIKKKVENADFDYDYDSMSENFFLNKMEFFFNDLVNNIKSLKKKYDINIELDVNEETYGDAGYSLGILPQKLIGIMNYMGHLENGVRNLYGYISDCLEEENQDTEEVSANPVKKKIVPDNLEFIILKWSEKGDVKNYNNSSKRLISSERIINNCLRLCPNVNNFNYVVSVLADEEEDIYYLKSLKIVKARNVGNKEGKKKIFYEDKDEFNPHEIEKPKDLIPRMEEEIINRYSLNKNRDHVFRETIIKNK